MQNTPELLWLFYIHDMAWEMLLKWLRLLIGLFLKKQFPDYPDRHNIIPWVLKSGKTESMHGLKDCCKLADGGRNVGMNERHEFLK